MVDMNKLQETLTKILEERKELTGEGIKHVVDAILAIEAFPKEEELKTINEEMNKQQELYVKMGREYMYGGQS